MTLKVFMKLVEIQTKVASVLPFLVGVVYTLYRYQTIKPVVLLLFFVSMISIDFATTALNNLMDYKKAKIREGYNYEVHNAMVYNNLTIKQVRILVILLVFIGAVSGIILVILTDIIVLVIGIVAFTIGISYSFGPVPISRTPLGEIFSGVLMGGFIYFVAVYIQIFSSGFIRINYFNPELQIIVNIGEIFILGLIAVPMIAGISNIMLANNICDIEEDVKNHRYTLSYYIGKKNALYLYEFLVYLPYVAIGVCILLNIVPLTSILVYFTLYPVCGLLKVFKKIQTKKDTFVNSVKIFILITSAYGVSILLGALIQILM